MEAGKGKSPTAAEPGLAEGTRVESAGVAPGERNVMTFSKEAEDFVYRIKSNFDEKADALTEKLGAVADNLKSTTSVNLSKTPLPPQSVRGLWVAIRNRSEAIGYNRYAEFIDRVLCQDSDTDAEVRRQALARRAGVSLPLSLHGVDAYQLLRVATQVFLLRECGVAIEFPRDPVTGEHSGNRTDSIPGEGDRLEEAGVQTLTFEQARQRLQQYLGASGNQLPYLERILDTMPEQSRIDSPYCFGILRNRLNPCLLELIWSYWHEEGMLVQTINAISRRFQNRIGESGRDPLAHLELDPLRPLNNLLWGYLQDEFNRLSVPRRTYEYDHHYGLMLYGKAVGQIQSADSRSKFIEAFHNLLYLCAGFYKEDADTTVVADGFPLLNALREVHLILAQGAHNQFGDLPWTARVEMLIQQWLIARPETREFLRGRIMVPYQEPWMGQVDTMKTLQHWTDVTVTHFRNLGVYGERVFLSIRYDDWIDENRGQNEAKAWARYWQLEIQGYIHAYRAVTGVDLTERPDATAPSVYLRNRLAAQVQRRA